MPSLTARLLVSFFGAIARKHPWRSVAATRRAFFRSRAPRPSLPWGWAMPAVDIARATIAGHAVYTLRPRGPSSPAAGGAHLFYLHGGAYVSPVSQMHWRVLYRLVKATGCTVTVPLYPLAPAHQARDAVKAVREAYRAKCEGSGRVVVAGDSAGGGLAAALALVLRDEGAAMPAHLVLITPWLDVALAHPTVAAKEAEDPFLSAPGLRETGRWYAGEWGVDHPLVSPSNAAVKGLPPTMVFAGTRDILHGEAVAFARKLRDAGVAVDLVEGPGMAHVWPLMPMPEGREALRKVEALLR